jgi:amino acid adenylation domain-containing protein/non-ribosomal peptide synthase protein (TIGR01720 family)
MSTTLAPDPLIASSKRALLDLLLKREGLRKAPSALIPRRVDDCLIPLSFAQQRLWFLDQLDPGNSVYNMPVALRLSGDLDVPALGRSLNALLKRHEVLRATFTSTDGRPEQKISSELQMDLEPEDLRALAVSEREAEVQRLAAEEVSRGFDLSRGPLVRGWLLRLGEDEHVLLLTMHHIISDGWSVGVLFRDLKAFYEAFHNGGIAALRELPIQYADYSVWQRHELQSERLERELTYWKEQLSGAPSVLELPRTEARANAAGYCGGAQLFLLSAETTDRLRDLCRRDDVTPFMVLLAAYYTLLYRYTGQDDIVIGTTIANRNRSELEDLIGFFANTLALRTRLSGNPTFHDVLRAVRETALGAYAHQDLPFERLVDEMDSRRTLESSPLFQVAFALQNASPSDMRLPGLTVTALNVATRQVKYDLMLTAEDRGTTIPCVFEYKADLFRPDTIGRMAEHYQNLLAALVIAPETYIGHAPMLMECQRRQMIEEWNRTEAEYPKDLRVHQLFERQAAKTPDAIAVTFERQSLSYRELDRRANQVAHSLRTLGTGPDVPVGIYIDRSLEMIVGILGVLKAGGAYVPLDPSYPRQRLEFMLRDSKVSVILTEMRLLATLAESGARLICLDDAECFAGLPQTALARNVEPDNLAYIIYTSGSTGTPKGTLLQHAGLASLVHDLVTLYDIRPENRVLQFAPISFDASITEIFPALISGATVCLARRENLAPGPELCRLLEEQAITTVVLTPAVLAALEPEPLPALRTIVSAGDVCTPEIVSRWGDGRRFLNGYGPTEVTVAASFHVVQPGEQSGGAIPVGRPVANTRMYLLDQHLEPVPFGIAGEICVGGIGLARGYMNRPDLTAERFIPSPFDTMPGSRLYKTGDLGRYREDGAVEFLGRIDSQVKIRGFRIEMREIEMVLTQHTAVRECAVVAREQSGVKRLVAYIVPRVESTVSATWLRAYLQNRLPDYMIPSAFVMLGSLPLSPNGKFDQRALPAPDATRQEGKTDRELPRSVVEEQLADIWSSVLGAGAVGIHDNFFELGGDSILSIQIVARANQAGIPITPKQLFENQTIAELAAAATSGTAAGAEQGEVTGVVPLTPIQNWFFEQDFVEPQHWNQGFLLELVTGMSTDQVREIAAALLRHHDALRSTFRCDTLGWSSEISGVPDNVPVTTIDLTSATEATESEAIRRVAGKIQEGLNLATGPLMRLVYFVRKPGRCPLLLIVTHHLTIDSVSWRILLEDLCTAQSQIESGQAIQLPAKTTSFKRWAEHLAAYANSVELKQEAAYWAALLRSRSIALPLDFPSGDSNNRASARDVVVALTEDETRYLLQEIPKTRHTQVNEVLLSAVAASLAEWSGHRMVRLDVEGHGREDLFDGVNISRTVGWCTSLFPVCLELSAAAQSDPQAALASASEQLRKVPRRGIGYGLLKYLAKDDDIRAQMRALPGADVSFNYQGQLDATLAGATPIRISNQPFGPLQSPHGKRTHALEINGWVSGNCLQLTWTYSEALHRAETIERLAMDCIERLRALTSRQGSGFTLAELDGRKLDRVVALLDKTPNRRQRRK